MMRLVSILCLSACVVVAGLTAAADDKDTPKAAKTRKLLKTKVDIELADIPLAEALDELKEEVKGLRFILDTKNGVSRNQKVSGSVKDGTVEELLDRMLTKNGLGYVVISNTRDAYDGLVLIKLGKERGFPLEK